MKGIIIQGSARNSGNSAKVAKGIQEETGFEIINLCDLKIGQFDYDFKNQEDDFPALIQKLANDYELLIFVTPVYWYTMSGHMKTMFDRISDCLILDKETGRKLRGKKMMAVSCGSDDRENVGFFMPFEQSANYLGMEYLGSAHTWINGDAVHAGALENLDSLFAAI